MCMGDAFTASSLITIHKNYVLITYCNNMSMVCCVAFDFRCPDPKRLLCIA